MKYFTLMGIFIFTSPIYGLIDFSKEVETIEDKALLADSVAEFADEVGAQAETVQRIQDMEKELEILDRSLREIQYTSEEIDYVLDPRIRRREQLYQNIRSLTRYIRRTKNLAKKLLLYPKASSAAIGVSEQMETNQQLADLIDLQQREAANKEAEETSKLKREIENEKKEKEFITAQYSYINKHSQKQGLKPFHPFVSTNSEGRVLQEKDDSMFSGLSFNSLFGMSQN